MRRTWLRSVVTFAVALVVWLVASPGRAFAATSAPQCDARGAITFAPPPQLQPVEQSFDVDLGAPSCIEIYLDDAGVHPGNAPPPAASAPDPATPATVLAVPPAGPDGTLGVDASASRPPTGERTRLERPPRA